MRILIADDETLARVTLRSMIGDIYPNFEILEVTNGLELMNKAVNYQPHIAFVDINMPKFTGLQAIANLKEKLPLTQWLILTGHAKFDFAQEALSLGVTEFLVKPLRPSKLKEAMEKAVIQYNNQINRRDALFEQEVRDVIHGRKNDYNIDNLFLILLHLEQIDEREIGLLKIKVKQELLRIYDNLYDYALIKTSNLDLLLVVRAKKKETDFLYSKDIYNLLKLNCTFPFWMFELKQTNGEVSLLDSINNIISYSKIWIAKECYSITVVDSNQFDIPSEIEESYRLIENTASQIEKKNNIKKLINDLNKYKSISESNSKTVFNNLVYLFSQGPVQKEANINNNDYSFLLTVEPSFSPQISDVITYIDEHFSEDIGIKQISDLIGITPNYLSAKFKAEMNMRFIDYLTQKRIEKACFLLKNSNLFIHKIANEVGFRNVKHFSKIFKKYKGCLPSEY
ncbi:MAG: response regulator [Sphaerochaetaceae bacterium]|nr:response regulator [Sphaerochaetaceae bacterium]